MTDVIEQLAKALSGYDAPNWWASTPELKGEWLEPFHGLSVLDHELIVWQQVANPIRV